MSYRHLVLIDDDEDDQEIFLAALSEVSDAVTCTTYVSAQEALQALTGAQQTPDVIFLDLNMPLMNGQQFLVEIKKIGSLKHIPVIIFSTSSHSATIQATKELGAYDFITKPGSFNKLITILTPLIR
jgi:CheY-like chemotaxis protein